MLLGEEIMTYQAIAFDLDGTLLSSNATILESSKKAIKLAQQKGLEVFIVTGRHHTAVRPYYVELGLDTPVVCCNGTYLYDFASDRVLASNPLSSVQVAELVSAAKAEDIHLSVYTRDAMTYETLNNHFTKLLKWVESCSEEVRPNVYQVEDFQQFIDNDTTIWKVLISDPDVQKLQNFCRKLPFDQVSAEWSWVDRVDITAKGNSKGKSLAELLQIEGISSKEVIAFGDNFNDISMLELVGMGIAMGGSEDDVQRAAKRTIGSNNDDSIAQALVELLGL